MTRRTAAVVSGMLLAMVGMMAMAAAPATPAASGPRTYHDLYREALEYNRKTIVEAYRTIGGHDAKWDTPALEALELTARRFSSTVVPSASYLPDAVPDAAAAGRPAKQAMDLGCDDPMVLYAWAVSLMDTGRTEEAESILTKAVAGFEKSKYSRHRLFGALGRLADASLELQVRSRVMKRMEEVLLEVVAAPFQNEGARIMIEAHLEYMMNGWTLAGRERLIGRIEATPGADPWIAGCLRADLEIGLAWDSRGSGWANQVTEEGWKGFRYHLGLARKVGEAAHAARPNLPLAACTMMTVAMGQGDDAGVKSWLKKATDAQLDYTPAYNAAFNALRPRWGGSFEEMLEAGRAAARTKRYDTEAPWQFIRAVIAVTKDEHGGGNIAAWTVPATYKMAVEVLEGYENYHKGNPAASPYYSFHAAVEFLNDNSRRARELLDCVPGRVPPESFDLLGIMAGSCIEAIYLETFPDREAMNELYRAENKGGPKEVSRLLGQMIAKVDPGSRTYDILTARRAVEDLRVTYDTGAWVSLIGDAKLPAWYVNHPVRADGKTLATLGGNNPFEAQSRLRLPDRHYEILLKFKITERTLDPRAWFGLEFGLEQTGFSVFAMGAAPDQISLRSPGLERAAAQAERADAVEIHVIYFDGIPEVTVNGSKMQFPRSPQVNLAALPAANRLRLGSRYSDEPCAGVQVTELKIRKLNEKPK